MAEEQEIGKKIARELTAVGVMIALVGALVFVVQTPTVQDIWRGWGYEPETRIAEIEEDLELTDRGKRLFRATRPIIEQSTDFNTHCGSHSAEISVIGCYTGGKMYIYEITNDELADANTVTAAHELLHAAWERMGEGEKARISALLDEVYQQNAEWMESELEAYTADVRKEEMYTRAGTKLENLPEELEKHYADYFRNRAQIVAFYHNYEAPFERLKSEMATLRTEILAEKEVIALERERYVSDAQSLSFKIDSFNNCANTLGCFVSEADFRRRRGELETEQENLELRREALNQRIDANNAKIAQYEETQMALGELNDVMNSNITKDETEAGMVP